MSRRTPEKRRISIRVHSESPLVPAVPPPSPDKRDAQIGGLIILWIFVVSLTVISIERIQRYPAWEAFPAGAQNTAVPTQSAQINSITLTDAANTPVPTTVIGLNSCGNSMPTRLAGASRAVTLINVRLREAPVQNPNESAVNVNAKLHLTITGDAVCSDHLYYPVSLTSNPMIHGWIAESASSDWLLGPG